ncbi:MAG: 4-hydroxythreonine-4-phosphate dehydrogenase PdxA [Flavobacteriales bacterium]|nr:4-hydroxythreonine-4-phosphate dehydrogenase PdxA [Flavobacteriales bacterium]|tara:strand:+ start:28421 stop:29452 length:1032 start_codon:yes stop_codon:yes gene_type:complete
MSNKNQIILGISCGDINGVGIEIIIKVLSDSNLFNVCTPVLYIPSSVIAQYKKLYSGLNNFNYHVIKSIHDVSSSQLNVMSFSNESITISPGKSTTIGARVALQSLELATRDLKEKKINILLTLPVNKDNIHSVKSDFFGHTEYLSQNFNNVDNLMLLCNENLRIATVTNHIPISSIASTLTTKLIEKKIKILVKTLKIDFLISNPKIAVLGLNPHAGDSGLIGEEDGRIIEPSIQSCFNEGILVYGPYSADGFFGTGNYKNFDAILGMYHDQALIPFKLMSFGKGVNYTAGLSAIRVSPDHGVGYEIVGKNIASINSVLSAIFLGIQFHSNRFLYNKTVRKN